MATERPHTNDTEPEHDARVEDRPHSRGPLNAIEIVADVEPEDAKKINSAESREVPAATSRNKERVHCRQTRFILEQLDEDDPRARYMIPGAPCDFGRSSARQDDNRTIISYEDIDNGSVEDAVGAASDDWLSGKGFDMDGAIPEVREKLESIFSEESQKMSFLRLVHDYSLKHSPSSPDKASDPVDDTCIAPSKRSGSKSES